MTKHRRQHTKEFKKETVEYLLRSGETGKAVAESLVIPDHCFGFVSSQNSWLEYE